MFLEVTKHQSEINVAVLAMHHYHFQYYSTKAALIMMAICLVVFLAAVYMIMGLPFFQKNFLGILLAVGAPVVLFYNQRDRVVREGEAELADDFVRIAIQGREENVNLSDLKSYRVDHSNGTVLTLHFRDGRRQLKVGANGLYSDPGEFERFCNHFERVVITYNRNATDKVSRKTPVMLSPYMLIAQIILTTALMALFGVTMSSGKEPRGSFYSAVFSVLATWMVRYNALGKEKRYRRALDELDPAHR